MTAAEQSGAIKQLKRLRKKAEVCRYAHSRLMENARCWRCGAEFAIAILTLLLSVMVVIFYREIFPNLDGCLVIGIGVTPILILFVQHMGRIWRWGEKEESHALAVHIWGMWIREADFFEKKIPHLSEDAVQEGMREMERKYVVCMEKVPLIPARKFLCHKIEYRRQRILSEKIDDADENELAEIARHLGCPKSRGR